MRHWSFWEWVAYAALFVAAMIVASDTGLRIAPDLAAHMPDFVRGDIWAFTPLGLVILATIILLFREFVVRPNQAAVGQPRAISTSVRLQFYPNDINPICLNIQNIANWYALRNAFIIQEAPSKKFKQGRQIETRQWFLY